VQSPERCSTLLLLHFKAQLLPITLILLFKAKASAKVIL